MRANPGSLIILIVEDGDEYLHTLSRYLVGPRYLQAHSGSEALSILEVEDVDLLYLDMRFDRIPREDLLGDHGAVTAEHNGDPDRAWRHLQDHQGLFVLAYLASHGHGELPVILAYDFSREERRFEHLEQRYPGLRWVGDGITPHELRRAISETLPAGTVPWDT